MNPEKLNKDITKFHYNNKVYNFEKIIFEKLKNYSILKNNITLDKLEKLHKNKDTKKNVEIYRQLCFDVFRSYKFQNLYKKFGYFLIKNFFDKNALLQKTPSIRIHLPGEKCTPYHSDTWYGHGKTVRTFWIPLTTVNKDNTLYVSNKLEHSLVLMRKIEKIKPNYNEIHKLSKKICSPLIGKAGDLFSFSSQLIHGTEVSKKSNTRISFDFRIAKHKDDLGVKPLSNYYNFADLKKKNNSPQKKLFGTFYTNLCNGISAKTQMQVCNLFCKENNINIKGGDSEILPLKYLPVFKNYITDKTLKINCIIVFGLDIFNYDVKIAKEILYLSLDYQIKLIFCNESIFFDKKNDIDKILKMISKKK